MNMNRDISFLVQTGYSLYPTRIEYGNILIQNGTGMGTYSKLGFRMGMNFVLTRLNLP